MRTWWHPVLDWVFPVFCVDCKKEGEWWCSACTSKLPLAPLLIEPAGDLASVTALFSYREPSPLASLIHAFKYQYTMDVATVWKSIIVQTELDLPPRSTIMPIPLFRRRERERGFNQAAIIAGLVAERHRMPLSTGQLVRSRATAQQAKLGRVERFQNVADAFAWVGPERIPESIVLVDDVYTTGATMGECARVLKAAGAGEVRGVVLAHG